VAYAIKGVGSNGAQASFLYRLGDFPVNLGEPCALPGLAGPGHEESSVGAFAVKRPSLKRLHYLFGLQRLNPLEAKSGSFKGRFRFKKKSFWKRGGASGECLEQNQPAKESTSQGGKGGACPD